MVARLIGGLAGERVDGLSFDEHGKIGIGVQRRPKRQTGYLEGVSTHATID